MFPVIRVGFDCSVVYDLALRNIDYDFTDETKFVLINMVFRPSNLQQSVSSCT